MTGFHLIQHTVLCGSASPPAIMNINLMYSGYICSPHALELLLAQGCLPHCISCKKLIHFVSLHPREPYKATHVTFFREKLCFIFKLNPYNLFTVLIFS